MSRLSNSPVHAELRGMSDIDWFDQDGYGLRFGWGPNGLRRLAPLAEVVVIVDVLSFSTAVDVALGRGAVVLPYKWHDGNEDAYGEANAAVVASKSPGPNRLSLRPSSLAETASGTRLVLPSPNGSALAFGAAEAGARRVVVASLRNAGAVARSLNVEGPGQTIALIAAGERWRGTTGPLRPAIEDLLGAGAVLRALGRAAEASPEALVAMAAFNDAEPALAERLRACGSGRELIGRGFAADVELAADCDASTVVPVLVGQELVDGAATG